MLIHVKRDSKESFERMLSRQKLYKEATKFKLLAKITHLIKNQLRDI